MLPIGSLTSDAAAGFGLIAVCEFIGQAPAALQRKVDRSVRAVTVTGGLAGLALALLLVFVDFLW